MTGIEIVDTGLVYRNPKPALCSRHAYFPTVVELLDGELLVGMDIGSAFEAIDVRSFVCRSHNGGTSWTEPQQIFRPEECQNRVSTSCRIANARDGGLIGWACLFDRRDDEQGLANPDTGGFCATEFGTVRSTDAGITWSSFQPVRLPLDWNSLEICAPPYPVGDSRLLVVSCPWPNWAGQISPWGQDGLAFVSADDGKTWPEMIRVFHDPSATIAFFEQSVARLSDGRLMAICWAYDTKSHRSGNNRVALSDDDGCSFLPACETPLKGETSRILGLQNMQVLVIYRRLDEPGLWAQVAGIDSGKWTPLADKLLWAGPPQSRSAGKISYMNALKFGCPAILRRKNGDIFVVFWCVEDCTSSIRWFRLEVHAE